MSTAHPGTVHTCTVCACYPAATQARLDAAGRDHTAALARLRAGQPTARDMGALDTGLSGAHWAPPVGLAVPR